LASITELQKTLLISGNFGLVAAIARLFNSAITMRRIARRHAGGPGWRIFADALCGFLDRSR
jgi:hypothetical protein